MSDKFYGEDGTIIAQEEDHSKEDYLAKAIVKELGNLLNARANDIPHRFLAPPAFAGYMQEIEKYSGNTDQYSQFQIGYGAYPIIVRTTIRPRVHLVAMEFQSADGMRLFTLEIEYNNAIPEKG